MSAFGRSLLACGIFVNGFLAKIFTVISLQFFISLVSLPILIAWGLPVVGLAIVGNVLFIPCITLFLLFSILLVLSLPFPFFPTFFGYLMNVLVGCWVFVLQLPNRFFYRAFPFCGYAFLSLFFCALLCLLHLKISQRKRKFVFVGITILFLFYSILTGYFIQDKRFYVMCGSEELCCYHAVDGVHLVDHGGRRRVNDLTRWAQYRLPNFLAQKLGATFVDRYEIARITESVCQTVYALAEEGLVGTVYVRTVIAGHDQRLIAKLQEHLAESGVILILQN